MNVHFLLIMYVTWTSPLQMVDKFDPVTGEQLVDVRCTGKLCPSKQGHNSCQKDTCHR